MSGPIPDPGDAPPDLPRVPAFGVPALDPDKPLKTTRQIKSPQEYAALAPGYMYVDPEGKTRKKPWTVTDAKSYETVPDGETYLDPEGKQRQKPSYEGVDVTAQTLYDMAINDKEKFNALARSYGKEAVKKDERTGEWYVEGEGGKLLKPGHGSLGKRAAAYVASEAAPTAGAVLGGIGGAAAGSAVPFAGTTAGAIGGAGVGAAAGQGFNDLMMGLAGTYDRTGGEEAGNLAVSGAVGGAGEGVGRGLVALAPGAKDLAQRAGAALPKMANKFLGTDPEGLKTAVELADKGVAVPPSTWAKEAPHVQNIVEVFDPAFHTNKPLRQSAERYYEREAGQVLETLGAKPEGSIVNPTAAASTEKAGTALLTKVRGEMAIEDTRLRDSLVRAKDALGATHAEQAAQRTQALDQLREAEEGSRRAAQKAIDTGFQNIQGDVDAAMKATQAGESSGDLWNKVGMKFAQVRRAIGQRAGTMYKQADTIAGDELPNIAGLPERAQAFLDSLPESFQSKYPDIVKKLRDFAGETAPDGRVIKEPVTPTFGQLHNMRSIMRGNVNYHDLTPDIRDGTYKFFAGKVDEILHDKNASPALKAAADMLDKADAYYAKNIKTFKDKEIQAVLNGLESGMPADPKMLYNRLVREGRTELTDKARRIVGPTLWAGVKAADVQEMLDASRTLVPGQIDGRAFAKQVLDRHRSNMLESVHGKETADKLLRQAQYIEMLNGKLPVEARPGDTVSTIIDKARKAADELKEAAKADPLGTLGKEMKKIEHDHRIELGKVNAARRNDPLSFLYKETTGASEAADRILGSEDLVFAAANKFGEASPEFNLLRQLWTQKVLQGGLRPGDRLEKISPEVQRLMLPGVSLDQMQTLAKNMQFLMSSKAGQDTAKSMAAVSRVEHPWANIVGGGGSLGKLLALPAKVIPFSDAGGRYVLGSYYGAIRKLTTSPVFLRWLEKGLNGPPEARDAAREAFQKMMQDRAGAVGAAVGEQGNEENGSVQRPTPQRNWRAR